MEMRKKIQPTNDGSVNIKKSSGCLYDIDFIKSFVRITRVERASLKLNFEHLQNNFNFLKQIELLNQNIFNTRLSKIPTDELKLKKLSIECGFEHSKYFMKKLIEVIQQNRNYYQEIFN
jgi:glutamine synthetase adenylyltransferase